MNHNKVKIRKGYQEYPTYDNSYISDEVVAIDVILKRYLKIDPRIDLPNFIIDHIDHTDDIFPSNFIFIVQGPTSQLCPFCKVCLVVDRILHRLNYDYHIRWLSHVDNSPSFFQSMMNLS